MTSKREISAGTEAAATFESIDADFLHWKNRVLIGAYEDGGHGPCLPEDGKPARVSAKIGLA